MNLNTGPDVVPLNRRDGSRAMVVVKFTFKGMDFASDRRPSLYRAVDRGASLRRALGR